MMKKDSPGPRRIHVRHRAATAGKAPPLLFLHGGYVHSSCWDRHFLPWFAERGYDCYAPDFSGHGSSEGFEELDRFGLDDFLDDALQVIETLPEMPVVIAHSMGCTVAELLMERSAVRGGVLMGPVPTSGTGASVIKVSMTHPQFFSEIERVMKKEFTPENMTLMRDLYFAPDVPAGDLIDYADLFQPESSRAVSDMLGWCWHYVHHRPKLPVLVVGGEFDGMFPPWLLGGVARRWQAETQIVPRAGHVMIFDPQWPVAAKMVAAWLGRVFA